MVFRNDRWLSERNRDRTLRFLSEQRIPLVCVDEPQGFPTSVPPVAEATAEVGVVRFHGRNAETWAKRGATVAERFDYAYGNGNADAQRKSFGFADVDAHLVAHGQPHCDA